MSDILLLHSGFLSDTDKVMRPYPPLWLLNIAAYLKSRGFAVDLLDTTFLTLDVAEARVKAARAPMVGIYVNLMARANAVALARAAKAGGSLVAIGGQEPGNYARDYLERGADIVIHGEAELTFAELIPHLAQFGLAGLDKIDGISFLNDKGEVQKTTPRALIADLDMLPFPDRSMVDMHRYFAVWKRHHGMKSVSVMTSRGCPYTCTWCSHSLFGQSHRRRSAQNVVAEILEIRETYGPDHLFFADDVFTLNRKWLEQFVSEMKRHGLRLPFETITREDRLDEGVIDLLADLGCLRLWVGAESGSQRILDSMQRRTDAERMREMAGLTKARGIRTGTFVMVGYEGESWADIDETARHLRLAKIDDVLTTIVHPVKGTAYYDLVADRIVGGEGPWENSTDRALTVKGRRSRRFYRHAQHWLAAQGRLGHGPPLRRVKARLRSALSRVLMYATRFEVEMADLPLQADAFDSFAAGYDREFARTAPGWMLRQAVWRHLDPHVTPGMRALDLGCGTGEDALWLARSGCEVTAVDASPAMLDVAWRKAIEEGVGDRVETRLFDLNVPQELEGKYDLVLSDFGALNCVVDLAPLGEILRQAVAPDGLIACVVMGRFCALETLWYGVHGKPAAWRRWSGRTSADIGGKQIPVRYWQPGDLAQALGPSFRIEAIHPVGLFLPPSDLFPLIERRPRLFAALARWERRAASMGPLAYLADHHFTLLRRVA